jgi:hypothetical protein
MADKFHEIVFTDSVRKELARSGEEERKVRKADAWTGS